MKKKFPIMAIALLLVCSMVVGVTLAYLTDVTDPVTNTFTVGNVKITLDEADVDEYGVPIVDVARVTANEYKLIPGHTYTKDPTVHLDPDSESCWLFVKVENGLAGVEAETTIAAQMEANGWLPLEGYTNIWYYQDALEPNGTDDIDVTVFSNFTIRGDLTGEELANYLVDNEKTSEVERPATIVITACAIQADGFETAELAAEQLPADFYTPAP